jgi:glycosyltransferase involved in cell wall biosynthesis
MRIAILNWSSRKVGGVETYLDSLIAELVKLGNEVSFCFETDNPADRDRITLPPEVPSWCVATLGTANTLQALSDWHPDVLYTHKVLSSELEEATLAIAPAVFFAHDYQGMCISGNKTHQFPSVKVCDRQFGAPCLLHYFPHRCGGLNPVTMIKLYRLQTKRMALLPRYQAVVTHSRHMLNELIKHGVPRSRAHRIPFLIETQVAGNAELEPRSMRLNGSEKRESQNHIQLLFSGRMEQLKGGHVFLDALSEVQRALGKKVTAVFAGDGRERQAWEKQGLDLERAHTDLKVKFVGWVEHSRLTALLDESHLLVAPSLWPEPFGLAGPEAGRRGVPAAAFAVGGITEWLEDGVNGYLASSDPATAKGLARAIIRCLEDAETYTHLRRGAARLAQQYNVESHLGNLMSIFNKVIAEV